MSLEKLIVIQNKLDDIYKDLTYNITHIYHREDLLLAIDLVYHSVLSFNFMGRQLTKGWTECLIIGDTKCGKCFAKDTKIMMYDTSIKNVQDIKTGDKLMGDDSKPRTVLSLITGREKMYEIYPVLNHANPYTVNESHILSVKNILNGKVKDIPLRDLIKLKPYFRQWKYKGYKVGIKFKCRKVNINPYFLGIWLGDGQSCDISITTIDKEVIKFLKEYAKKLNMKLSIYSYKNRTNSYAITNKNYRGKKNKIRTMLKKYNLINNKHIPYIYKCNSEKIRLEILAGIIDADGYKPIYRHNQNTCQIILKNKILANDVVFLARSLGFRTSIKEKIATIKNRNFRCIVYRITIYGNLWKIPTKVERKQWKQNNLKSLKYKSWVNYGFKIIERNVDSYYGFTTDGNKRFLLSDFTVVHNTETIQNILKHYKLGEYCTGENTSFAGLIGGLQQVGKKWMIGWGKLPLNNRRLLFIDEVSGLDIETISNMSGIRSSGVAEVVKIQTEKTGARTRLIWSSNPRSGRKLDTYNYGIEAIKELMGRVEDIARFDFAITVASGEVDLDEINREVRAEVKHKYTSQMCNELVLWCWSRQPDQIIISADTIREILQVSTYLGNKYSSKIPLVEPAEQRIKIARLSVALAGRLFSTDETYKNIVVKPEHVKYIYHFLDRQYSKTSMGYDLFSAEHKRTTELTKPKKEELTNEFKGQFKDWEDLRDLMLNLKHYRLKDIVEHLNWSEAEAKQFNRWCSKNRLIESISSIGFIKMPIFTVLLKSMIPQKQVWQQNEEVPF